MENKIYIFGHKNPDTDSIGSSMVKEILDRKKGTSNVEAKRLGNINKETQYMLDYLNLQAPELLEKVEEGQEVCLVDHNEFNQSVEGIEKAKILSVTDHHRIANFETSEPLYYNARPYGCTCTILYKEYAQRGLEISKEEAILMASAIISDTLLFKSPTCTKQDVEIANKLSKIAGVDIETYGKEMLKAGTDISEFTPYQVINIDSKEFNDKNTKFEISQVNAVDLDSVFSRQSELEDAIQKEIQDKNLDFYMFAATDILNANSKIIAIGNKANTVEKAFGVNLENNTAMLNNVVSRKKQMLPNILNNLD